MTRFGSVCSGIEAASVAFAPLGWKAAWFSEIESFPCAVLSHHYPEVPNLGDMSTLPEAIRSGLIEAPDVLCGGTPCQAFSVAGSRKSLGDARGNLSLIFCEIANAIDDVRPNPCVALWENVPGVLSTSDNAFGCFLAGLAGEDDALQPAGGKWSNAGAVYGPRRTVVWRTLDAQFFGLAQQRRRVFVVASARDDFDPVKVLFEFEGVRRDTAPSRKTREDFAAGTLRGTQGGSDVGHACEKHLTAHTLRAEGFDASEDGTGRGTPFVPVLARCVATREGSSQDYESTTMVPVLANTLQRHHGNPQLDQTLAFDTTQITSATNRSNPQTGDPCHTLAKGAHAPAIAFSAKDYGGDASFELSPTPRAGGHATSHANGGAPPAVMASAMQVRRLTPRECERLQGFPDDYTLIPHRGKPASDGPRYKALGNSWAVPCVRWIGARINHEAQA